MAVQQAQVFNGRNRIRKKFGGSIEVAEMPNLIEVQKASYDDFLMVREPAGGRPDTGLQTVFKSVSVGASFKIIVARLGSFTKRAIAAPGSSLNSCSHSS